LVEELWSDRSFPIAGFAIEAKCLFPPDLEMVSISAAYRRVGDLGSEEAIGISGFRDVRVPTTTGEGCRSPRFLSSGDVSSDGVRISSCVLRRPEKNRGWLLAFGIVSNGWSYIFVALAARKAGMAEEIST